LYAVDGDRVTGVWPVAARGRMAPFTDDEASAAAPSSANLL
jgi:hypothetical protein